LSVGVDAALAARKRRGKERSEERIIVNERQVFVDPLKRGKIPRKSRDGCRHTVTRTDEN